MLQRRDRAAAGATRGCRRRPVASLWRPPRLNSMLGRPVCYMFPAKGHGFQCHHTVQQSEEEGPKCWTSRPPILRAAQGWLRWSPQLPLSAWESPAAPPCCLPPAKQRPGRGGVKKRTLWWLPAGGGATHGPSGEAGAVASPASPACPACFCRGGASHLRHLRGSSDDAGHARVPDAPRQRQLRQAAPQLARHRPQLVHQVYLPPLLHQLLLRQVLRRRSGATGSGEEERGRDAGKEDGSRGRQAEARLGR